MNATQPITPRGTKAETAKEIDLGQLLMTFWRGKGLIFAIACLAVFAGGYYAFSLATPYFRTTATVVQETKQEPVIDFSAGLGAGLGGGGDQNGINTELEVLRSRGLLEKLVADLSLTEDPEFNHALRPEPAFSVGGTLDAARGLLGKPPRAQVPLTPQQVLDGVVDNLREALAVGNIRQSYVYTLTATTEDPRKSALIANTLARLYIFNQLEVKAEANITATAFLTEQVAALRLDLETDENAVKDFNAQTDLINADTLAALSRQVKELRERLSDERETRTEMANQLTLLQAALIGNDPQQIANTVSDRVLDRLLPPLIADPTADRTAFDTRVAQVTAQLELELRRLDSQITALEMSIADQEEATGQQATDLVALQQLEREAQASGLLYEYFLGRLKETSAQSGIESPDSRVLSRAVVPLRASEPRRSMVVLMSLIAGLVAGMALVLIREMTQATFRGAEELETRTGYTVLGQIPKIPARKRGKVLEYLKNKPTSAAAESVRNLRTSLLLSDMDTPPQVIMSTSSVPGEGKTTQSLALAQNLAGLGKKVLLVEGDIRKRVFAEYFNIKDRKGLLAVLRGDITVAEAVVHEPSLKADVLIGEKPTSTNAADVFSSPAFRQFLRDMKEEYDYIIIDTPPVLAVPDARVIAQVVDAVLYTVRWDHTTHRQVDQGLRLFEGVNVRVSGLVLSQINPRGQRSYGYGDAHGTYGSYHDN